MAIYNQRNSTTSTNLVLTPAELLQRAYATRCGVDYLQSQHSASAIQRDLETVSLGTLRDVFGSTYIGTIASRVDEIYVGSTSLTRSTAASSASKGANDLSGIVSSAIDRGAKLITVAVSYVELYNATTGRTYLTLPRAASVIKYDL